MKIIGKQPSREKCAESGWFAWDYLLDEPVEREFILKLRPLGGFTYLDMLKQPFFKIDSDYYMIKGIQGNDYFRIAVHGKHEDQLEELERTITDCMENNICYNIVSVRRHWKGCRSCRKQLMR